jgi:hypothetical protein
MESNFEVLKNYRDKQKVIPELVEEYCGRVIDWLKNILGVNDISNIELFEIRRNVETVLKMNYELASDFNEKNAEKRIEVINLNIIGEPVAEVVNMFLSKYSLSLTSPLKLKNQSEREMLI